ncbi:hypothetical protein BOX15_Mlig011063g1, partial [Macrostomum lignano]
QRPLLAQTSDAVLSHYNMGSSGSPASPASGLDTTASAASVSQLRRQLADTRAALARASGELFDQRQRAGEMERELSRVTAVLARSQRAGQLDSLLADNERLRCRAVNAEDDFRDQYDALMTEFDALLTENERLQAQLEAYRSGGTQAGEDSEREFWQQRAESLQSELNELKSERQQLRQAASEQQRLTEANANLRERVQLLEAANSAMSDELAQKSVLVDRCLPATGGANRNLRDVTEEMALKNVHLEAAVERLALELQSLQASGQSAESSQATGESS